MRIHSVVPFVLLSASAAAAISVHGSPVAATKPMVGAAGQAVASSLQSNLKPSAAAPAHAAASAPSNPVATNVSSTTRVTESEVVPHEVMVDFADGASAATRARLRRKVSAVDSRRVGRHGVEVLTLRADVSIDRAQRILARSPFVDIAALSGIAQLDALPTDPQFSQQWGLHSTGALIPEFTPPLQTVNDVDIDAPEAWATTTGAGVRIGILDTGVDAQHQDIAPNVWTNTVEAQGLPQKDDDRNGYVDDVHGWDAGDGDADPTPNDLGLFQHGTGVASTAAAPANGIGMVGVAPSATIVPIKGFTRDGVLSDPGQLAGIDYAAANHLDVVNGSFSSWYRNDAVEDALRRASETLFVFTAGNDGRTSKGDVDETPKYPCAYDLPNILCVGSTTSTDQRAVHSNYGLTNVDLFAPGEQIRFAWPATPTSTDGYTTDNGTSFAAPEVAAAAALLKSQHPTWSPADLKARIMATVDRVPALTGLNVTGGRLNVNNAVNNITPPPLAASNVTLTGGVLAVTAAPQVPNTITVSDAGASIAVEDSAAGLPAPASCTAVSPNKFTCPRTAVSQLRLDLGDHVNAATSTVGIPLTYIGGSAQDQVTVGAAAASIDTGGGNDTVIGGPAADTISTGAGDDRAYGGQGNDSISTGDGKDRVAGDEGDDTLMLGAGDDQIDPARDAGSDTVYGGDGDDLLFGGDTVDSIYGENGNDIIDASSGNGSLVDGGAGDDLLRSMPGTQRFVGGAGIDTISYELATAGVRVALSGIAESGVPGENDTIETSVENVVGSPYADTVVGNGGANTIEPGAGSDLVQAGAGDDRLLAGATDRTNDDYAGGDGRDTITYGPTNPVDGDLFGVSVSLDGVANDGVVSQGEADQVRGDIEDIVGTSYADRLVGNAAANSFTGGLGDDTFIGGAGTDTYDGGSGDDVVSYADKTAPLTVSLDDLAGDGESGENENVGPTIESIVGGSGSDTLSSARSGTRLNGGPGADTLTGGDGDQVMLLRGGGSDQVTTCGAGNDTVRADAAPTDVLANASTCETSTTVPTAQIDSGPSLDLETADTTPEFSFSEPGGAAVGYQCRIETTFGPGDWTNCSSQPWSPAALEAGGYTFAVQALVGGTPTGPIAKREFRVNTDAPKTEVGAFAPGTPLGPYLKDRYFFQGEYGLEQRCRVDAAPLRRCGTSTSYHWRSEGVHEFETHVADRAGHIDPVGRTVRVTLYAPPETTITSGPTGTYATARPTFAFASPSADTTGFECRLVAVDVTTPPGWTECSGSSYRPDAPLANGRYRFEVRARDGSGMVDPTAATKTVEVRGPWWGFVIDRQPGASTWTPGSADQANSSGGTNVVTRAAAGDYTVTFPNLVDAAEGNAQVNAFGTASANRCTVGAISADGTDARVRVRCWTPSGSAADTSFALAFQVDKTTQASETGYVAVTDPPTASYPPLSPQLSFNSLGALNSVVRSSTAPGRYTAVFTDFAGGGVPLVTAVGTNSRCQSSGFVGQMVNLYCYDAAGVATDSAFSVAYANQSVFTRRRGAHLFANNPTSGKAYVPGNLWNSQGAATTARKVTTGQYEVIVGGIASTDAIPLVSAVSNAAAVSCKPASWAASGTGTAIQVRCTNAAGTYVDAAFTLVYASALT